MKSQCRIQSIVEKKTKKSKRKSVESGIDPFMASKRATFSIQSPQASYRTVVAATYSTAGGLEAVSFALGHKSLTARCCVLNFDFFHHLLSIHDQTTGGYELARSPKSQICLRRLTRICAN